MTKNILIHIGLHKTGTSFLQALLAKNAVALAAQGCVYAGKCTTSLSRPGDGIKPSLARQVDTFLKDARFQTLIFSDEDLSHNVDGACERLVQKMSKQADVSVIVYLRDVMSYYKSFYCYAAAALMKTDKLPPFDGFAEYIRLQTAYLNAVDLLQSLRKSLPADALITRRFSKASFCNQNLEDDFCHVAGIESSDFIPLSGQVNVSPTFGQTQALYFAMGLTRDITTRQMFMNRLLSSPDSVVGPMQPSPKDIGLLYSLYGDAEEVLGTSFLNSQDTNGSPLKERDTWRSADNGSAVPDNLSSAEQDAVREMLDGLQPGRSALRLREICRRVRTHIQRNR